MSIQSIQNNIERYQREVTMIIGKIAETRKKVANAKSKALKAQSDAAKSKSASTIQSKLNEAKRYAEEEARLIKEIANLEKKQAVTQKKLDDEKNKLSKEQAKEDKKSADKLADTQKKTERKMKVLDKTISYVQNEQRKFAVNSRFPLLRIPETESYDVFISHASEDKATFVDELVSELISRGVKVWYDKINIGWGQSLRASIEIGLQQSKFAIVVLSQYYLKKYWTNQELNGLFSKETTMGNCILPIWHNISREEVAAYSLMLADRSAANTQLMSASEIADLFVNEILNNGTSSNA